MEMEILRDLFVHELKDMANAERQILRNRPKFIRAATDVTLCEVMQAHHGDSYTQLGRIELILSSMGKGSRTNKRCKGMEGILEEGLGLLASKDEIDREVLDAGIIAAWQKVEHYEMAVYGTLAAYAELLGDRKAQALLEQTLVEVKAADQTLTEIAKSYVNAEAAV